MAKYHNTSEPLSVSLKSQKSASYRRLESRIYTELLYISLNNPKEKQEKEKEQAILGKVNGKQKR